MSTAPIVSIEGLTFSYGDLVVLEEVNLSIDAHDVVCVVGPNGGGKTTLLRLMLGALQPNRGTVRIFGLPPEAARARIGYTPQRSQLDPRFPIRVLEVVLMGRLGLARHRRLGGARRFGPHSRADREAAIQALEEVNLADRASWMFSSLSGGQQQRVMIARALVSDPDLLLFDEPTANLDLSVEGDFYTLIQRLRRRLTLVLVSHDIGFVSHLVNRVFCVNRRVWSHTTSEITPEILTEMYGEGHHVIRHEHDLPEGEPAR